MPKTLLISIFLFSSLSPAFASEQAKLDPSHSSLESAKEGS